MAQKIIRPKAPAPEPVADAVSVPAEIKVYSDHASQVAAIALALSDVEQRAKLVTLGVAEDLFSVDKYRELWKAIEEANRRGIVLDRTTLAAYVADQALVELAEQMREHTPDTTNALDIVDRLRWGTSLLDVAGQLPDFIELIKRPVSDRDEVIRAARTIVDYLETGTQIRARRGQRDYAKKQALDVAERRARGRYPYGLPGFDVDEKLPETSTRRYRTTIGTKPGKTTVLTALSGNGKSTTLDNILLSQIKGVGGQPPRKVLYGAWEDTPGEVLERMAAFSLGLNLTRLQLGELNAEELSLLSDEMTRLEKQIVFLENPVGKMKRSRSRNDEVLADIHSAITESGADIAVFDLWARAFSFIGEGEEAEALYRMQAIARETGCHCILVQQQLLKEVEKREDKQPTREAIKGSGEWTGIADTILAVYRPALYKPVPDTTIDVLCLKQRRGRWPFVVEFDFDPEFGTLKNGRVVEYDSPNTKPEESKNTLTQMVASTRAKTKKGPKK